MKKEFLVLICNECREPLKINHHDKYIYCDNKECKESLKDTEEDDDSNVVISLDDVLDYLEPISFNVE